jgi:type II secretory pathway predicted ATPase ExeA
MYKTFYGLREKPFSLLPDPTYLYLSKQHQIAMTLLEYGLESQAGFCVITGSAGTGKTTLIRHLLGQTGNDVSVGLISNTHHALGELMHWILLAFGLETTGKTNAQLYQIFADHLIAQYAANKRTMLIIDEAQNMSASALEELRMLSNINSEKDLLLQIVLVGQQALRYILRRPDLEQFAQRIAVDYHLEPLLREETHGYIRHRLVIAGGKRELFSDDACDVVFRHSGGTPRIINLLCDLALVYAYADQATVVSGELVEQVVHERQGHGALLAFNEEAATKRDRTVTSASAATNTVLPDLGAVAATHKTAVPITTLGARGMSDLGTTFPLEHAAAGGHQPIRTMPALETPAPKKIAVASQQSKKVMAMREQTLNAVAVKLPSAATQFVPDVAEMTNQGALSRSGKESEEATDDTQKYTSRSPAPPVQLRGVQRTATTLPPVSETSAHVREAAAVSATQHSPVREKDATVSTGHQVPEGIDVGWAAAQGQNSTNTVARRYLPLGLAAALLLLVGTGAGFFFSGNSKSAPAQSAVLPEGKLAAPMAVTTVVLPTAAQNKVANPPDIALKQPSPVPHTNTLVASAKKVSLEGLRSKIVREQHEVASRNESVQDSDVPKDSLENLRAMVLQNQREVALQNANAFRENAKNDAREKLRLKILQNQRDAALARAESLEQERQAALNEAEARERALAAAQLKQRTPASEEAVLK